MARKKGSGYRKKINQLTFGLFDTLIDVILFFFFFYGQQYSLMTGKKGVLEAVNKAIEGVRLANPNNFSRLISKLKSKGYLERKKDYFKITALGRERLIRKFPKYEEERPWDGKLYLITYDIPEEKRRDRDFLRKYLQKLGCGMLQKSVWLTPYNPKRLIADFVKERGIVGLVLVSELKEGSAIGGKDIREVVNKIYRLEELDREYRQFVKNVENKKLTGSSLVINYLAILKKDPQLPFELLPDGFWGEEAFEIYKKEIKKIALQKNK